MANQRDAAQFRAAFLYNEEILSDFEALYREKRETPLGTRVVLGLLGGVGAVYFGWMLYKEGAHLMRIGYLLVCSVLLVLAFSRTNRADETPKKYRKGYLNRHADFKFDDEGFELRLENQKNYARSKYSEVYGLFDTDRCFYFLIKGRAYYILPKDAVSDGQADALRAFMEKKCRKKFQHFDLPAGA